MHIVILLLKFSRLLVSLRNRDQPPPNHPYTYRYLPIYQSQQVIDYYVSSVTTKFATLEEIQQSLSTLNTLARSHIRAFFLPITVA